MPQGSKLRIPPTNYHLLAAQQKPYKKIQKLTHNEKCLRIFWKKVRRMDHKQKHDKTERIRGLGRKMRGNGNQMTALRFQTGEKNTRHPSPPFGVNKINDTSSYLIAV